MIFQFRRSQRSVPKAFTVKYARYATFKKMSPKLLDSLKRLPYKACKQII